MTNNDVLRRVASIFELEDYQIAAVFAQADKQVSTEQINAWLKDEDDSTYARCTDIMLATFLNGFINDKRGKKDGPQPVPETRITNNIVLTKLKIALNLKAEDVIDILELAGLKITKYELTAFSRKPQHLNYRECKDQFLHHFLNGVRIKYRQNG